MNTSDFPSILANVQGKTLMAAYDEEFSTWEAWAAPMEVADFKEQRLISAGSTPVPPRVYEGEVYTYTALGEKDERVTLAKYGYLASLTWEAMVNDDLNALTTSTMDFGGAARSLENDLAYAQITSNPTMNEDSTALFHADHSNLTHGASSPPSATTLDTLRSKMAKQKGIESRSGAADGRRLNIQPETLLVPQSLVTTSEVLVTSTVKVGGTNSEPNPQFLRQLRVVADSRLDDDSTTAYYLVGPRNRRHSRMVFLRGYRRPFVEQTDSGPSVDGITFKLRHVAAAKIADWRYWQKHTGVVDPG